MGIIMMVRWHGNVFPMTGPFFMEANPLATDTLPSQKGQFCGTWIFTLMLAWRRHWTNNWVGGDLIRDDAHVTSPRWSLWSFAPGSAAVNTVFWLGNKPGLGSICGKWGIHDDVIKWKHFPRYWPFVRETTGHRWIPVTKRPVTRSFEDFFDLRLNKRLSKHWWASWFEPSRPLRRHLNVSGTINQDLSEASESKRMFL